MERINEAINEIEKINQNYNISNDSMTKLRTEISEAKVCIPIIGKFSSGKSALVNTILGYGNKKRILKEDITPETAIPAEILYTDGEDEVTLVKHDGQQQKISVEEFRKYQVGKLEEYQIDAKTIKNARIKLRCSALRKFPDVMLVDMPGFESGIEIHNRAIDDYLPKSLAYIITFPADDMIVRSSVGNILKELCVNDMPICITITKYDKSNHDFEETYENLKISLKKYIGDRKIRYCMTSSFTGDVEELEEFLEEIQEQSQEILTNKYKKILMPLVENTENYLKTVINTSKMSESELGEQEERLQKKLANLNSKFMDNKERFEAELSECVEQIVVDVENALSSEESRLIIMVMNNQDINDHLNVLVRREVTKSVRKHLIPKIKKYLKKVEDTIKGESMGDVQVNFAFDAEGFNKDLTGNIVAGITIAMLGPLVGVIAALLLKRSNDKKREEQKQKIKRELRSRVFPEIIDQVRENLNVEIQGQIERMNSKIENQLNERKDTLEKAMNDVKEQKEKEKQQKDDQMNNINIDLQNIAQIKQDLL